MYRVEHFAIFEKLVFEITSKVLRIRLEHVQKICSLECVLLLVTICSTRIPNILEVIARTIFWKSQDDEPSLCGWICFVKPIVAN